MESADRMEMLEKETAGREGEGEEREAACAGKGPAAGRPLRPVPSGEELRQRRADCAARLEELPGLRIRLAQTKEQLRELTELGLNQGNMAVARFERSGVRVGQEEIYRALVKDLRAKIAADSYEIGVLEGTLGSVAEDRYYLAVEGRYLLGWEDGEIAETLGCDQSTLRRNRVRLMNTLAVVLG